MNLKIIDENNFVFFIVDKNKIPKLEKEFISDYLKEIFIKIKSMLSIDIYGYYDVIIYLDKYYGMIFKIMREDDEYLNYYGKQIEMKIVISNNPILYKIEDISDIDKRIILKSQIYSYDGHIYVELEDDIDFVLFGNLAENSEIIYEDSDYIKNHAEKIEIR